MVKDLRQQTKMQMLLLATALLGYLSTPSSALIFPGKCEDKYLIETNLLKKNPVAPKSAASLYDFFAKDIDGNVVSMKSFKGKVLMVVNAASSWGLTAKNYAELGVLKGRYAKQGLEVLVFPSNTFNQEPMDNQKIKTWNAGNEGKDFQVFYKIAVNGACAHPLYTYMKSKKGGWFGDAIKWNYTKFLIDRMGRPVNRYGPNEAPMTAEDAIKEELKKGMTVEDATEPEVIKKE